MSMKKFIIHQNLNTPLPCLPYKNAYHMMHNSNMKTKTHQRKNLNSPRHFQILPLKKSRSNCLCFRSSCQEFVNLVQDSCIVAHGATRMSRGYQARPKIHVIRVVFQGARATIKCSLDFC